MAGDFYVNVSGKKVLASTLDPALQQKLAESGVAETEASRQNIDTVDRTTPEYREFVSRDHVVQERRTGKTVSVPGRFAEAYGIEPPKPKKVKKKSKKKQLEEKKKEAEENIRFNIGGETKELSELSPREQKAALRSIHPLALAKSGILAPSESIHFKTKKKSGGGFGKADVHVTSVHSPTLEKNFKNYILTGNIGGINAYLAEIAQTKGPRAASKERTRLEKMGVEGINLEFSRQGEAVGRRKSEKKSEAALQKSSRILATGQKELVGEKYGGLIGTGATFDERRDIDPRIDEREKIYTLAGKRLSPDDPRIEKRKEIDIIPDPDNLFPPGSQIIDIDGKKEILQSDSKAIINFGGRTTASSLIAPEVFKQVVKEKGLKLTDQGKKLIDLYTVQPEQFSFIRTAKITDPKTGATFDPLTGIGTGKGGGAKIKQALGKEQKLLTKSTVTFDEQPTDTRRIDPFNRDVEKAYESLVDLSKRPDIKGDTEGSALLVEAGKLGLSTIATVRNLDQQIIKPALSNRPELTTLLSPIAGLGIVAREKVSPSEKFVPPKPIEFSTADSTSSIIDDTISTLSQRKLVTEKSQQYADTFGFKPLLTGGAVSFLPGVGSIPSLTRAGVTVGGKVATRLAPQTTLKLTQKLASIKTTLRPKQSFFTSIPAKGKTPAITTTRKIKIYPEIKAQVPLSKAMVSDAQNIMKRITTQVNTAGILSKTRVLDVKKVFGVATRTQPKTAISFPSERLQPTLRTVTSSKPPVVSKKVQDVAEDLGYKPRKAHEGGFKDLYEDVGDPLIKRKTVSLGESSTAGVKDDLVFSAVKGENIDRAIKSIHGKITSSVGKEGVKARPQFATSAEIKKFTYNIGDPQTLPQKPLTDMQKFFGIKTPIEGKIELSKDFTKLVSKTKYDRLKATTKEPPKLIDISKGQKYKETVIDKAVPEKSKATHVYDPLERAVRSDRFTLRQQVSDVHPSDLVGPFKPVKRTNILGTPSALAPKKLKTIMTSAKSQKVNEFLTSKPKTKADEFDPSKIHADTRPIFSRLGSKDIKVSRPTGVLGPVTAKQARPAKLDPDMLRGVTPKEDITLGVPAPKIDTKGFTRKPSNVKKTVETITQKTQDEGFSVPLKRLASTKGKQSLRFSPEGKPVFKPRYPQKIDKDALQPKGVSDVYKDFRTIKTGPSVTATGKILKIPKKAKSPIGALPKQTPQKPKSPISFTTPQVEQLKEIQRLSTKTGRLGKDFQKSENVLSDLFGKKKQIAGIKKSPGQETFSRASAERADKLARESAEANAKAIDRIRSGAGEKLRFTGQKRTGTFSRSKQKKIDDALALKAESSEKGITTIHKGILDTQRKTSGVTPKNILKKSSEQAKKKRRKPDDPYNIKKFTEPTTGGLESKGRGGTSTILKTPTKKTPPIIPKKQGPKKPVIPIPPPKRSVTHNLEIKIPKTVKANLALPKKPTKKITLSIPKPPLVSERKKKRKPVYSLSALESVEIPLSKHRPQPITRSISKFAITTSLVQPQKERQKTRSVLIPSQGEKSKSRQDVFAIPKQRATSRQKLAPLLTPKLKQQPKLRADTIIKPITKTKQTPVQKQRTETRRRFPIVSRTVLKITPSLTPKQPQKTTVITPPPTRTLLIPPSTTIPPSKKKKKKKKGEAHRDDFWGSTWEASISGFRSPTADFVYGKKKTLALEVKEKLRLDKNKPRISRKKLKKAKLPKSPEPILMSKSKVKFF
jgi:hypothetical protein